MSSKERGNEMVTLKFTTYDAAKSYCNANRLRVGIDCSVYQDVDGWTVQF